MQKLKAQDNSISVIAFDKHLNDNSEFKDMELPHPIIHFTVTLKTLLGGISFTDYTIIKMEKLRRFLTQT